MAEIYLCKASTTGLIRRMENFQIRRTRKSSSTPTDLTVTNMGPGPVILTSCAAKPIREHWRKQPEFYGMLNPIHGDPIDPHTTGIGPFGGGLPAKIDAGEMKSFYFPYTKDCFLKDGLARVGINDTYQRIIWCRRSDMKKVYQSYRRDFELERASQCQ